MRSLSHLQCPDEDPKLEQGSRSYTRGIQTPIVQDLGTASVGTNEFNIQSGEASLHAADDKIGALYLTVDAPQTYREAMCCSDADGWVEAISVEYENLCHKGVFDEVEAPLDICVHEGQLVFTEKIGSEGEVVRKKVRIVTKGYTEVWCEDYWNTYSPTLGHNTLFSCLAYAAALNLGIHQLNAVAVYLNSDLMEVIYL